MKYIHIKNLLTLVNNYFPEYFYSIMDIDAHMPKAELANGSPAFEQIDLAIKSFSTGFTTDFNTLLSIAEQFNDVKDLFLVINNFKRETSPYNDNSCKIYIKNSLAQLVIEDLDLVELICKDKYLEASIKSKLGDLPLRITCNNS